MLKDNFLILALKYTDNLVLVKSLWDEIELAHTYTNRHYHNLDHLQNMYNELLQCKDLIDDWDGILFSLYYHDIVYKVTNGNNEERSAEIAFKRLRSIQLPDAKIETCVTAIIATKHHAAGNNSDINFLLDADMAILGCSWAEYENYFKNVRLEYSIYPDFIYNAGRKKVLKHFLSMQSIYATSHFQVRYEAGSRNNIKKELGFLI